jgi:hypothetical protein
MASDLMRTEVCSSSSKKPCRLSVFSVPGKGKNQEIAVFGEKRRTLVRLYLSLMLAAFTFPASFLRYLPADLIVP